jgi:DNA polymerase III alpha subunit
VILYQEQVLRIAHELAGLSLTEGDLLRRAMSHFDPGKRMITLKEKFVAGAKTKSAVPVEIAERLWDLMAAFAGYGFPKAHAASYARVAWRSAWCKAHHPAEFMTAVLANGGGYYSQRAYLTEVRRMGLGLRAPHVNLSRRAFSLRYLDEGPVLFMGLDQVRDLTHRTQMRILKARPFHSMADFLTRVDPRPAEAENLVRVGAFEGMGTIPALLQSLKTRSWQQGQMSLFATPIGESADWSREEQAAAQEALLGVSVNVHPLELVADRLAAQDVVSTLDAAARIGQRVRVAGMRQTWRRTSDRRGGRVYFMALEDLEGFLDVVIYGDVYRRYRTVLVDRGPYVVEGVVGLDESTAKIKIRAERFWRVV